MLVTRKIVRECFVEFLNGEESDDPNRTRNVTGAFQSSNTVHDKPGLAIFI